MMLKKFMLIMATLSSAFILLGCNKANAEEINFRCEFDSPYRTIYRVWKGETSSLNRLSESYKIEDRVIDVSINDDGAMIDNRLARYINSNQHVETIISPEAVIILLKNLNQNIQSNVVAKLYVDRYTGTAFIQLDQPMARPLYIRGKCTKRLF